MKNIVLAAFAAALVITSGAAFAGTPGSSNGMTDKRTGNTSADYVDPVFGSVSCNETQHRKFDTVSCKLVDGPNSALAGTSNTVPWYSDFNGAFGSFTYSFSADGSTYSGKATYN
ncbi:MAG: hypothetical protein V4444_10420 [Pseudomonadota bacterium]